MPDVEKIICGVDASDAVEGANKANEALEKTEETAKKLGTTLEKTFEKATKGSKTTVIGVDRTAASLDRAIRAFEKKTAFAGMTGADKTLYEMNQLIQRAGEGTEKAAKIREAGMKEVSRQLGLQQKADADKEAAKTAEDSAKAAAATKKRSEAQEEFNRLVADTIRLEQQETNAARERARVATEAAQYRAAGSLERLDIERDRLLRQAGAGATEEEKARIKTNFDLLKQSEQKAIADKAAAAAQDEVNRKAKETAKTAKDAAAADAKRRDAVEALNKTLIEEIYKEEQAAAAIKKAARAQTEAALEQARYRATTATGRLDIERQRVVRAATPGATAAELEEINKHFDTLHKNQVKADQLAARNKLRDSLRESGQALTDFSTRFFQMAGVIAGGLGWLVKTDATIERSKLAFSNLIGSRGEGEKFFRSIVDYSKQSVFGLDELAKAGQQALARGFKPEQALEIVKVSFATAAAMGAEAEAANRLILALSQIQAKGRVSAEEMNQVAELGVRGWQALADYAGKTVPEMMKLAEKGMLDATVAVKVLTAALQNNLVVQKDIRENTISGQLAGLTVEIKLLAESLDRELAPRAKRIIAYFRELLEKTKEYAESVKKAPEPVKSFAEEIAIAGLKIAGFIGVVGLGKRALAFLLGGMSGEAIATLAAFAGAIMLVKYAWDEYTDAVAIVLKGRPQVVPPEDIKKVVDAQTEYTKAQMRLQAEQPQLFGPKAPGVDRFGKLIGKGDDKEAKAAAKREAERLKRVEEEVTKIREDSAEKAVDGFARIQRQYEQWYRIYVEKEKNRALAARNAVQLWVAVQSLGEKEINDVQEKNHKASMTKIKERFDKTMEGLHKMNEVMVNTEEERGKLRKESFEAELKMLNDIEEKRREMQISAMEREKEIKLAQLESTVVLRERTVQEKIDLEKAKLSIEQEYAAKSLELQRDKLRAEQIAAVNAKLRQPFLSPEEAARQAKQAYEYYEQQIKELELKTDQEVQKARIEAAKRTNEIIVEEYKKHYERIKQAASTFLDNLFEKTKSWAQTFKDMFKQAILNPLKEALAGFIADVFTRKPQIPGQAPQKTPFEILLGKLGDIFRRGPAPVDTKLPSPVPPLGDPAARTATQNAKTATELAGVATRNAELELGTAITAAQTAAAAATASAAAAAIVAGKCCQGGGAGSMVMQAVGGSLGLPSGGGEGGGGGGIPGGGPSLERLKDLVGLGGTKGVWQGGGTLGKVATSDLAAIAGAGLIYAGMKRGGWSGVGMTTVGGALVGAKIGTMIAPGIGTAIGAAVGAAAGFVAGMIRKAHKGAEDIVIEKIKQVYGVNVDKAFAKQIVELARTNYGGNLAMAVLSPQAREMIELYAMSTGQNLSNMPRPMYPVRYAQGGGSLALQPTYDPYGMQVESPYSGPTLGDWNRANVPPVYVMLNPQQANDLFEGRVVNVVEKNPDAVSTANTSSLKSGTNRSASRSTTVDPLTSYA